MSATYRKLKPALDNPLVVTQAIEKTKNQISQMGNDAINAMSSEEMAEKDDALTRYLNMYGYNDDNAANGVFQTVFKNNAQEIYAEQKAAQVNPWSTVIYELSELGKFNLPLVFLKLISFSTSLRDNSNHS